MTPDARLRGFLATVGALAGLAYYLLVEEAALQGAPVPLQRLVIYGAIAFFPAFGLIAGPLPARRAAGLAGILALATAALATLAGFRFSPDIARLGDVLEPTGKGLIVVPFVVISALSIPVFTAMGHGSGGWRDYHTVLPLAWTAGLKALISLLFLVLFWALYFASNALLDLVGIRILDDLADWDPGPFLISGLVTGLALAVTCELEGIIGTVLSLFLRLLRILLPPVTAVMTLFVLATVLQGLDQVFDSNSAAATMMGMAAAAILLIAATLNFHNQEERTHPAMKWSLRVMGGVLPVVSGIAIYAIWLRVADHGWTPPRLLAMLSAVIVVLFVLPVTLNTPLARPGWQGKTLNGFVLALLGSLALGAAWFTPALDAQRVSAASQLSRLLAAEVDTRDYSFWPLAREWGIAGEAALAAFEATDPPAAVKTRIATARTADSRWQAERAARSLTDAEIWDTQMRQVRQVGDVGILPKSTAFNEDALQRTHLSWFIDTCVPPALDRCVVIAGDFFTTAGDSEWMFLAQRTVGGRIEVRLFGLDKDGRWDLLDSFGVAPEGPAQDVIAAAVTGDFTVVRPTVQGIQIGTTRVLPQEERYR